MRGGERESEGLFSYLRLEDRIAQDHPLRAIRALVNEALAGLSSRSYRTADTAILARAIRKPDS